jgi:hypothetical protein
MSTPTPNDFHDDDGGDDDAATAEDVSPETDLDAATDDAADDAAEPDTSAWADEDDLPAHGPLFPGDTGQLPANVRALLVTLLKRRYVAAETHPREYQLLLENESALRTRLNDQFLELVVNREYQVAYKEQAVAESGSKFPTLLYDKAYTQEETIAHVALRRELRSRHASGDEVAFVDRADLLEEIASYRPADSTDRARDARNAENAVDRLLSMDLLLKTQVADRYRIPTVLEVLLPVDKLTELLAWLRDANGTSSDEPVASTTSQEELDVATTDIEQDSAGTNSEDDAA